MTHLTIEQFDAFFRALHGHPPYPWQNRLAERALKGGWPGAIDLPTGGGKTACIDIAIFALAAQASRPVTKGTAPRRIFFCVNRRVVVDEAYQRAQHIAAALVKAGRNGVNENDVLRQAASSLRQLAGLQSDNAAPPLDVLELRGGIYRDNRWTRSITQPTVVCTTIDQLGSRLLFRGYGVSSNAAPVQAALCAYDSLILLDEAHISEPFRQTLESVRRYLDPQKWAQQEIGIKPAIVVSMTATPPEGINYAETIRLTDADRDNELLNRRLTARKTAELREVDDVAKAAVDAATELAENQPVAVGVIVNRVATAKEIYEQLRKKHTDTTAELVIGSMRPIDRDEQAGRLHGIVGSDRPSVTNRTSFIVATQCLEVGADYDFDVLVTECASLDALRQRFGRLNRGGRRDMNAKPIEAKAVVLIDKKAVKAEEDICKAEQSKDATKRDLDFIYGAALARTWNWLNEHATDKMIDFGIDASNGLLKKHGDDGRIPKSLLAPSASLNAPVMLPAYVDLWCQTAPRPVPDPDVSLFLHGPQRGEPDVQVCWRADLVEDDADKEKPHEHWCDVVALLPPTSAECMRVPIGRLRTWLKQADPEEREKALTKRNDNDLYNVRDDEDDEHVRRFRVDGVIWRGIKESKRLRELTEEDDLRPGDTLVLPVSTEGWKELGHIPESRSERAVDAADSELGTPADADFESRASASGTGESTDTGDSKSDKPDSEKNSATAERDHVRMDIAEKGRQLASNRGVLRLHPSLRKRLPEGEAVEELFDRAGDGENLPTLAEWRELLTAAAASVAGRWDDLEETLEHLARPANGLICELYPDRRGVVLTTRNRIGPTSAWFLPALDEGDDEPSRLHREKPVLLAEHARHVFRAVEESLKALPLKNLTNALDLAARLHDVGKADERFQAMLRRTDRTDAWLLAGVTSTLLAKSDGLPRTPSQLRAACRRAGLPAGFRHEMLSVQLAEHLDDLPKDAVARDLALHLIATHHGHARPFAPVVNDEELPAVEVNGHELPHEERRQLVPSHRLDSGIAERFWSLTRCFGWWGLAYLEAVLRLADSQASTAEDSGDYENADTDQPAEAIA